MELTARYGLEFNPFIKNSKDIIFESSEFKETVYRLNCLLHTKGFGVITASPGIGKTTIARSWASSLNKSLFKVIYTSLSTITVNEFYRNLAMSLDLQPSFRKYQNFHLIQDAINRMSLEKKITPVIIIDEANYVIHSLLNDLPLLFNFEMDSRDRAVILLIGSPLLNNNLNLSVHEPLRQRIIMNYNISPLSKEEGKLYISHKLKAAGATMPVFDEPAIEAILNASDGIPRLINKYCNSSMVIGHAKSLNLIGSDLAMQAINDNILG